MPEFTCRLSSRARPLPHVWEHTVGSGHAPLAPRADWQAQMRRCRDELGFRHVRFHGLLCDDMGALVAHEGMLLYSFFNADQVFDFLLSVGMRPFVELSFMPTALASGDRTVFKYRANVTPPRDLGQWATLIRKLVEHWVDRYGAGEVGEWFFEVWNEPNLKAFWTGSRDEYFELYRRTAEAIKGVHPALRVGGPATARNAWITEVRALADRLYRRADWRWARNGEATLTHGWTPERGFLPYRWRGYDEGLLLYLLGLGSPTHRLPAESYAAWGSTYRWREAYGQEYLHAGPLFTHQLPQVWVDFRGIPDEYMRERGLDYFENSRRATRVQQAYAVENPRGFKGYGDRCWGLTASDGPGWVTRRIDGVERRFFDYLARGAPDGPDDGTLAPWVAVTSLPFAPELVLPTVRYFDELRLRDDHPYGYKSTFNPTFGDDSGHAHGWLSRWTFGINEGPLVLMIENHRSELLWRVMCGCPYVVDGLRRAGFGGGWLHGP